jgi:short-subunit dehydrogenase
MHRSLSVEHTARDIYKGLKQGRDVVVPGLVNKLYTYLFSQILPSAAVGAITQVQYSTVQYSTVQYSTVQYSTIQYPSF